MCPTYDYLCNECGLAIDAFVKYEDRDIPQSCPKCGGQAHRAWLTAPQVRTAKTSRTFLDGHRNDGYKEEIKASQLDAEAMNHDPASSKYKELKAEAATRRLLNNNPQARGKRYRLKTGKTKKQEEKK